MSRSSRGAEVGGYRPSYGRSDHLERFPPRAHRQKENHVKHVKLTALLAALAAVAGGLAIAVHATTIGGGVADARIGPYTTAHAGVLVDGGVYGAAHAVTTPSGKTILSVHAEGLTPGARYGVHVHLGRCEDFLGHFRYDPSGAGQRTNEVWLDLEANAAGRASDDVTVPAVLARPLSVVVHAHGNPDVDAGADHPGPRIACGNLEARS
jgi:hypothetical protein